jgi:hypothetical protein
VVLPLEGLAVTDPERDHLLDENRDLERSRDRWRLAALVLAALLILPVLLGGLAGVAWLPRMTLERARAEQAEARARAAEAEAVRQRQAAEQARQQAEKAVRDHAKGVGPGKE